MQLLLFRHGIAASRESWQGEDAHRPLTDKGRVRTRQASQGLRSLSVTPTHILTSPFIRAHETAEILYKALGAKHAVQICDELIPDSPADKLFPLLSTLPQDGCIVCVGHEPQLSDLAGLMIFGKSVAGLAFRKAGACMISFEDAPKPGRGVLEWWLIPSLLRTLRKV